MEWQSAAENVRQLQDASGLEEPLIEALDELPPRVRADLCVDEMLAVHVRSRPTQNEPTIFAHHYSPQFVLTLGHVTVRTPALRVRIQNMRLNSDSSQGDVVSASPRLLLPALIQLSSLSAQRAQLAAESEALIAAQADAVRKLAASNTSVNNNSVVGSAANFLRGKLRAERPDQLTSTILSSGQVHGLKEDATQFSGQHVASIHIAHSADAQVKYSDQGCVPTTRVPQSNVIASSQTFEGRSLCHLQSERPDAGRAEPALTSVELTHPVAVPGRAVQGIGDAATGSNGAVSVCQRAAAVVDEDIASLTCCVADRSSRSTCTCTCTTCACTSLTSKNGAGSLVGQSGETTLDAIGSSDVTISVPGDPNEVDAPQHSITKEDTSRNGLLMKQSAPAVARNAKAAKYVDTLLGRANRDRIPELEARQALEYFEAAKAANGVEDYKAACSYFETSFLLNPKLTTLISTANMHLKLRNPTVAAEIYMRLLQNPSVPQREREVALRKLAVCETMLGTPHEEDSCET